MLRRRLLVLFGSLVVLLVAMAAGSLYVLQGVLGDLDHINNTAMVIVDKTSQLDETLTAVEIELYQLQLNQEHHLDQLMDDMESLRNIGGEIGEFHMVHQPVSKPYYQQFLARYPQFERQVSALATAQDPAFAKRYNFQALASAVAMRQDVRQISLVAREHARQEQIDLARAFRQLVLGVGVASLLVINVAVLVLLRAAASVLKPVDRLVETSRQLSNEQFDHRAEVDPEGEFRELALAYNHLAERVQVQEHQRMETLHQAALTLNHELNNAMAIIEFQLQILSRQAGRAGHIEDSLRQIRDTLHRMAQTVDSLKNIRRIVLTDYIAGVRMLDLRRSTEDPSVDAALAAGPKGHEGAR